MNLLFVKFIFRFVNHQRQSIRDDFFGLFWRNLFKQKGVENMIIAEVYCHPEKEKVSVVGWMEVF